MTIQNMALRAHNDQLRARADESLTQLVNAVHDHLSEKCCDPTDMFINNIGILFSEFTAPQNTTLLSLALLRLAEMPKQETSE